MLFPPPVTSSRPGRTVTERGRSMPPNIQRATHPGPRGGRDRGSRARPGGVRSGPAGGTVWGGAGITGAVTLFEPHTHRHGPVRGGGRQSRQDEHQRKEREERRHRPSWSTRRELPGRCAALRHRPAGTYPRPGGETSAGRRIAVTVATRRESRTVCAGIGPDSPRRFPNGRPVTSEHHRHRPAGRPVGVWQRTGLAARDSRPGCSWAPRARPELW